MFDYGPERLKKKLAFILPNVFLMFSSVIKHILYDSVGVHIYILLYINLKLGYTEYAVECLALRHSITIVTVRVARFRMKH